jgi:trimeric autotransporter adhesin
MLAIQKNVQSRRVSVITSSRTRQVIIELSILVFGGAVSLFGQTLQFVPVNSTYAGGTKTVCATATDKFGDGCLATQAYLMNPWKAVADGAGNLYLSDITNNIIQKIDAKTRIISLVGGAATTVCAGATDTVGDGCPATQATFKSPDELTFDPFGNLVIADAGNNRIRSIDLQTGNVTSIAGTGVTATSIPSNTSPKVASASALSQPVGVAFDAAGNLYISNATKSSVALVVAVNGAIVPDQSLMYNLAGSGANGKSVDPGPATSSIMNNPRGLSIDAVGNVIVPDYGNAIVRKITSPFENGMLNLANAVISTIAGTGTKGTTGDGGRATAATVGSIQDAALDYAGNIYLPQYASPNVYIRILNPSTGIINTLSGTGANGNTGDNGPTRLAAVSGAVGVSADRYGRIFIVGYAGSPGNVRVASTNANFPLEAVGGSSASQNIIAQATQAITLQSATVSPAAAPEFTIGTLSGCTIGSPLALNAYCTVPVSFQPLAAGMRTAQLQLTDSNSVTATIGLTGIGVAPAVVFSSSVISTIAGTGTAGTTGVTGPAISAQLSAPRGGMFDSFGNLYFADSGNNLIRKIDHITGAISTVAGTGTSGFAGDAAAATSAQLNGPTNVVLDAAGDLYIADSGNNRVRFVDVNSGLISTIAGTGTAGFGGDSGLATAAILNDPQGLALDLAGNVYVADTGNHAVRRFNPKGGAIVSIAGTGTAGYSGDAGPASFAALNSPAAIALDLNGNIFIADSGNSVVRVISPLGQISTYAGQRGSNANAGDGGAATSASLLNPSDVTADAAGDVYIASGGEVRMVNATGIISTVAGTGAAGSYSGEGGASTSAVIPSPASNLLLDSAANVYISDTAGNLMLEVASATPRALDFGTQASGSTSASQVVSVLNVGNSALAFSNISISAGFTQDSTSLSSCSTTTALAAGQSCTLTLSFDPSATGTFSGSMVLTDNALNTAGATQTIALTGTSEIVSSTLTPTTAAYAAAAVGSRSAPQNFTLTNGGSGTLTVTVPVVSTDFVIVANTCTTTLAAGANCTIAVDSQPTLIGATSGALTLSVSSGHSLINLASTLTGAGSVAAMLSPTTATYATVPDGSTSAAQTFTVTNEASNAVGLGTATVSTDFTIVTNTCTASLAANSSCTFSVASRPTIVGATNGTLSLSGTNGTVGFLLSSSLTGIGAIRPSFSLAELSNDKIVLAGVTATFSATISPVGGYTGTVKLSCSGVPSPGSCYASPASVSITDTSTTSFLVFVNTGTVSPSSLIPVGNKLPLTLAGLFASALLLFVGRKRKLVRDASLFAFLLMAVLSSSGCGSSSPGQGPYVAPGTYTLTVTATDGSNSQTMPFILIVQ